MAESRTLSGVSTPTRRVILTRRSVLGVAASTTILLLAGLLPPQSMPARGATDDSHPSDKTVQPPAPASRSEFVAEIRRTLAAQHDRMIKLADQAFRSEEAFRQVRDRRPSRKTLIESAQARYENAKILREVAETKVNEFRDGLFVQNLALAEGEIKIAREEIKVSREGTKQAENRLAKIKQASKGSVVDVSIESEFEGKVSAAILTERRSEFALEQAESKKKFHVGFMKEKRLRELQADIEKARSEEIATRTTSELEKAKAKQLDAEVKEKDLPPDVKRVLVLLDEATSVQAQIRGKLEQVAKEEKLADSLRNDIQDLTSRLRAIVEEADGESAALRFDKLKPQIQRAASRVGSRPK